MQIAEQLDYRSVMDGGAKGVTVLLPQLRGIRCYTGVTAVMTAAERYSDVSRGMVSVSYYPGL